MIFFQNSLKLIDVTEESINILRAVQEICGTDNNWKNNFTFTHVVDIFKGNKTQKVILNGIIHWSFNVIFKLKMLNHSSGHQHLNVFGCGIHWDKHNIDRLIHKLTLEGYLKEEMISSKSDIMNAYIRIGPEAGKLLTGLVKVDW